MPSTRGCLIPALRKMQSENAVGTWAGRATSRSLTLRKLLVEASLLTCVHVRLHLRSMRARANHVRVHASAAASAVRQTHLWVVGVPRIPLPTSTVSIDSFRRSRETSSPVTSARLVSKTMLALTARQARSTGPLTCNGVLLGSAGGGSAKPWLVCCTFTYVLTASGTSGITGT